MAGEKSGISAKWVVPQTQRQAEKRIVSEDPCSSLLRNTPQIQRPEDVDVNLSEVYFLIMHFLSSGPCSRAAGQLWNELLQHKLLPRRYHAWYSRTGLPSGDEDDDGMSFPLSYIQVLERNPDIPNNHLIKLLQQQLIASRRAATALELPNSRIPTAADVPTIIGLGSFSLLNLELSRGENSQFLLQLRWPHWQSSQVRGLTLRELGGGFSKHHRSPSIRAASYAILKPSVLVDKIQIIKKFRGHRNAVYCAIFDRTGHHIITGSDDRLVKIWSTESGFCLCSCRGHEGDITELSVSSGNALVASASNDCTIRVWRLPDGVPISVLRGHTGAVTAIAFSPRQSCEHHLLSSSDDGTCRIWDARDSTVNSRVYMPNPEVTNTSAKSNVGTQPIQQQPGLQISCCAFNADGSIFVTGSSDKFARVWDARKWNDEITGKPNYEMDVLKGHENAVNYVQFCGCAGPVKPNAIESTDRTTKFKNVGLSRDSIVTCSRDGSAIIWTCKTRRKNARYGHWSKAYHLRVPPPPMPPHPPRGGGPRQRFLPTPRGVNMIVWSLDNRFVLAAIMDCRICVWNAVDGSLVHSLTGHSKSTFVVDVHPFNPRIAMSAGYDGRVIIWDIWEGQPVRVYETGDLQIVDGSFSPDGTSLVVSDEVGQFYLLTTGQGQSQKDAKYDQFFLGDFRPLVRDIHGNMLDQETQLPPHMRNIRDLLCDANMIPYQEPYQSMYQQRRLGALRIEWQPLPIDLAVGMDDMSYMAFRDHPLVVHPNVRGSPVDTAEDGAMRWVEQPDEEMDWEQDNTRLSDDSGSDYSVSEESLSLLEDEDEDEEGTASSTEVLGHSNDEEDAGEESVQETRLRRSNRNKRKSEGNDNRSLERKPRKLSPDSEQVEQRNGDREDKFSRPRQANLVVPLARTGDHRSITRPKRAAATNALQMFSHIQKNEDRDEEDPSSSHQETSNYTTEEDAESYGLPGSHLLSSDRKGDHSNEGEEHGKDMETKGRDAVSESSEQEIEQEKEADVAKEKEVEDLVYQMNSKETMVAENDRNRAEDGSLTFYEKDEFCNSENHEDFEVAVKKDVLEKSIRVIKEGSLEPGDLTKRLRSHRRLVLKLRKNETDIMALTSKGDREDRTCAPEAFSPKPQYNSISEDHSKRKLRRLILKPPDSATVFQESRGGLSDTGDNGTDNGVTNASFHFCDNEKVKSPANLRRHKKKHKGKGQCMDRVSNQAKKAYETVSLKPTGSSPSSLSHTNERPANIYGIYPESLGEAAYPNKAYEIPHYDSDIDSGGLHWVGNPEGRHVCPQREVEVAPRLQRISSPEAFARFHSLDERYSSIKDQSEDEALKKDKPTSRPSLGPKSNRLDMNSQTINGEGRWLYTSDYRDRRVVKARQDDIGINANSFRGAGNGVDNALEIRKGRTKTALKMSHMFNDEFVQASGEGHFKNRTLLESASHLSYTKRTFGFESKQRDACRIGSNDAVQSTFEDRDEIEQNTSKGHIDSGSEGQDDARWTESESAGGQSDVQYFRHKRRTLGEIDSSNLTAERIKEDIVSKKKVRHMQSVMLEGVNKRIRVKGNRAMKKEKEASGNEGSTKRQGAWTSRVSGFSNYEAENGICISSDKTAESNGLNVSRCRGRGLRRFEQAEGSPVMEKKDLRTSNRARRDLTRTSDRDQGRQVDMAMMTRDKGVRTRKSLAWLLLSEVEEGTRYIPQLGDEVAYLRQGHEEYLETYKLEEPGPWTMYGDSLGPVEICQVVRLEYAILPDSGETCCKFTLEFSDCMSQLQGKSFCLTLPELTNFPDFIVEKSRYDTSIERRWTTRDRCKVWWRSQNGQGGEWWDGRIVSVKPKAINFPESPWERFVVQYKSDPNKPYSHSPWELFELGDSKWEQPHIDQDTRERLLFVLETAVNEPEDAYGLRKLKQLSCKSDFINRLPLPLTLDVLMQRLEKNYYHSIQAFFFDVELLGTNAESYCGIQHPMAQGLQAFVRDLHVELFSQPYL